ncbi:ImmA/IrrE family metallo-endopeptidase [Methylibium sp.]|uniref:ImmA/IrrE family metallo-endopeptidase n=1 Tax=Methylibium sp. TaxID=2067992 RepID=UPI003D133062
MHKVVHRESIKAALAAKGWDQKQLAEELGVSGQAVTNWMKGVDFPRPATLLKLASTLALGFDQLVLADEAHQPVIAFRKKGGTKTTEDHVSRARAMGALLKPLVAYLPTRQSLRTQISDTSLAYESLQATAAAVRAKLGIGQEAVLSYEHLIGQFAENDAVIVPVMWGARKTHENALHILLPAEKVTFIYLNLDTHLEDFKFWMAHELAHVFTPTLAGKDEGEDFADAFAGALLFPRELAHHAYVSASQRRTSGSSIGALHGFAQQHMISLYSVYNEVSKYAHALGLPPLKTTPQQVHATRNSDSVRGELVSATLFQPLPPEPATYIAAAHGVFKSVFFPALQAMLRERGTGIGYVQQVMSIALPDAQAIHDELTR